MTLVSHPPHGTYESQPLKPENERARTLWYWTSVGLFVLVSAATLAILLQPLV